LGICIYTKFVFILYKKCYFTRFKIQKIPYFFKKKLIIPLKLAISLNLLDFFFLISQSRSRKYSHDAIQKLAHFPTHYIVCKVIPKIHNFLKFDRIISPIVKIDFPSCSLYLHTYVIITDYIIFLFSQPSFKSASFTQNFVRTHKARA